MTYAVASALYYDNISYFNFYILLLEPGLIFKKHVMLGYQVNYVQGQIC